jgi:hypothetical protein
MSSLIFYTDAEQILVATDTLATDLDGSPMMFCSKALYLPHIRTIIAGTGMGMFAGDWAMEVNNRMALSGILNLDHHAPKQLLLRWREYKLRYSLPDKVTTTVYHFGLSEKDRSVCAFAYRSTSDFASERLGYGTGLKPECTLPAEGNLIEALPAMMKEQRSRQADRPTSERLYIGGECVAMHLTKSACNVFPVFQFEDYEQHLVEVFRKCEAR